MKQSEVLSKLDDAAAKLDTANAQQLPGAAGLAISALVDLVEVVRAIAARVDWEPKTASKKKTTRKR